MTDDGDALQSRQVSANHAKRHCYASVTSSVGSYELPGDGFRTPLKAKLECTETAVVNDGDALQSRQVFARVGCQATIFELHQEAD